MTPGEVVASHEGLVKQFAGRYQTTAWPFDDLCQEARIELWQAAEKSPGDTLQGVASYIIKRRILNVLTRKAPFAQREHQGQPGSRIPDSAMEWMGDDPDLANIMEAKLGVEQSAEASVMDQLHMDQVWLEIFCLPDRERAVAIGKYNGESTRAMAAKLGITSTAVSKIWNTRVVPSLTEALQGSNP